MDLCARGRAPSCFSLTPVHKIRVERDANAFVVSAHGELDAFTAPDLSAAFESDGLGNHARLVIDLSRVSFMDSTALGLLVRAVNGVVDGGGAARVVLPNSMARRIFEITTLDRVLPVSQSRAEALAELAS
jgi:anti-sigma B factor antagonist